MAETASVPRETLMDRLGFMTASEAVRAVRELCVPLGSDEYSIHGNIWPGNIYFDEEGKALLGEPSERSGSSRSAEQVEYLSPEYFWTDEGAAASDVYSLGLILYAACNDGYLPFQPKTDQLTEKDRAAALRRRMKGEHITVPDSMSRALGVIVRRALAYREEQRYVTAAELLRALSETDEALPPVGHVIDISSAAAKAAQTREKMARKTAKQKDEEKTKAPAQREKKKPVKEKNAPAEKAPAEKKARQGQKPAEGKKAPRQTDRRPAQPAPAEKQPEERRYTVQKDFERRPMQRDRSVAPTTRRRKKRTSPAVVLLSLIAIGILAVVAVQFVVPGVMARLPAAAEEPEPAVESAPPVHSAAPLPLEELMPPAGADEAEPADEQTPAGDEAPAEADAAEPAAEPEVIPVDDMVYAAESGVSLRTGPGTSYPTAQSLSRDTELHRVAVVGGWSLVEYEGREYYVSTALVASVPPEGEETPADESVPGDEVVSTVTVRASANLRTGPGTSNAVVATVDAGTVLKYTGQENGWSRVVYGGKEVYVSNKLVSEGGDEADIADGGSTAAAADAVESLTVLQPANIRAGAGTDSAVIGQVDAGVTLPVTGFTPPKWYQVTYNGREGYINSNLVDADGNGAPRVRVISPVHLRSGPGTGYQVLGTAQTGDTFVFVGKTGGWYQINYNGSTAYIAGNFVTQAD